MEIRVGGQDFGGGVKEIDFADMTGELNEDRDRLQVSGGASGGTYLAPSVVVDAGLGDGTTDATDAFTAAFNTVIAAGAGDIYIPASQDAYLITDSLPTIPAGVQLRLHGAGRALSKLKIGGDLVSPLISVDGDGSQAQHVTIESLSIINPNRTYTADAVSFSEATYMTLRDVAFDEIVGHAIYGAQLWDSGWFNVLVGRSGDAANSKAGVLLECLTEGDGNTGCNNVRAYQFHIEGYRYNGVELRYATRKCYFGGFKFHGQLPTPGDYPYPALILKGAYNNQFVGGNFAYGGDDHVVLAAAEHSGSLPAANNVFLGCTLDAAAAWAVDIDFGRENLFESCLFGEQTVNTSGSMRVTSGSANVYGPTCSSDDTTVISGTVFGMELLGSATGSDLITTKVSGDSLGRFIVNASGQLDWASGAAAPDVSLYRGAANRLDVAAGDTLRIVDGTWDGGRLQLGNYHLWVDGTGDLRIKSGAPASDTDGTVVGTQS